MRRRTQHGAAWWWPQIALVVAVAALGAVLIANVASNMARQDLTVNFAFVREDARFPIAESFLSFAPGNTVAWALVVAMGNTVVLTLTVILLSTIFGIPLALARQSRHALARCCATGLVEVGRNTPLVVQLLFWYGLVAVSLPAPRAALQPLGGVFLTNRGIHFTALGITGAALPLLMVVTGGMTLTALLAWRGRLHRASIATLVTALTAAALWLLLDLGLERDVPRLDRYDFRGGWTISPELVAALAGLSFYSMSFTAEIIRGGLASVPPGQRDAAAALGLTGRQMLRLVIVPQALPIIMPPMTSQFIGILKNSTLALVVGFPELNLIVNTVITHNGQALEGTAILMAAFLALAGLISMVMNVLEARLVRDRR